MYKVIDQWGGVARTLTSKSGAQKWARGNAQMLGSHYTIQAPSGYSGKHFIDCQNSHG